MYRALLAALALAPVVSGCIYIPQPVEPVNFKSSPVDVTTCRRLGRVGPAVYTTPGFEAWLTLARNETVARGGTDLLLVKKSRDWSLVEGVAYRCGNRPLGGEVVISVKG